MPVEVRGYSRGMQLGQAAYLDTNFIISVLDVAIERPTEPKYLFADLLRQKVHLLISPLTMDETWWTLLREWNKADGHGNIVNNLKKNPDLYLQPYLPRLKRQVLEVIVKWPRLTWVGPGTPVGQTSIQKTVERALDHVSNFNLAPRDAFHLQYAASNSADLFITSDPDFRTLEGFEGLDILVIETP